MSYKVNSTEDKAMLALADYGIGSDNSANGGTMRMVRGELSHVGKDEAKIIDKYGKSGEELVVSLADGGSINHITDKPQYLPWAAWLVIGATLNANIGNQGNALQQAGDWMQSKWWDPISDWWYDTDLKQEAFNIADASFETTLKSAERQLGPGGTVMKQKGEELGAIQFETGMQTEQQAEQVRNLVANQSFEGVSPSQTMMNSAMSDLVKQGDIKQKKVVADASAAHGSVVDDINMAKNQALSDYLTATEDPFPGSTNLTELEDYIASMQP